MLTRWLSSSLAPLVILVLGVGLVLLWLAYTVRRERNERLPYKTSPPRACGLRGKGMRLR